MERIFRGKTPSQDEHFDDGQWVEGYYICFNGKEHRIYSGYAETDCGDYYADWFNVRPETVGQYTGLTDKNGKKVFEGDLLEWIDRIVAVVWFDFNAQFDSKFIRYCNDKIVTNFKGIEPSDWHECKVIGNVFDNPELLEVK